MTTDRSERFGQLPPPVDPRDVVVEVPASEDDREEPPPAPPAASPELVAATQIARGRGGPHTIRRTQVPVGLVLLGVPLLVVVLIAVVEIGLGR